MRNPNRIDVFCQKLADHWKKVPDWRFGQLLDNVIGFHRGDPFYWEDDRTMQVFDDFFNTYTEPGDDA